MPSNARMTFRFEQPTMPKPAKPAPAAKLVRPEQADVVDQLPIVAKPDATEEANNESTYNHAVIETSTTNDGPYLDDIRALEDMIRRADSVVVHIPPAEKAPEATAKTDLKLPARSARHPVVVRELEQTEPDHELPERWSLPEGEGEYKPNEEWLAHAASYTRNDNPTWTRVFLSVTAAIATGALFGYMVLNLFTGEPMFPGKQTEEVQTTAQAGASDAAASSTATTNSDDAVIGTITEPKTNATATEAGKGLAEVPANEIFVLQYGVFRNADSTQLAAAQLKDVGLPAAIDNSDGYRVYAGIASTRAEAELLAAQMPNIEVYIKPFGGSMLMLGNDERSESIKALLTESAALARLIAQLTVSGLQDELPQPIAQEDADALKQAEFAWRAAKPPAAALTGEASAAALKLEQSLSSALASLASYGNKTSRYHLWNAQTSIMQAELADRELREALQPATRG